MKNILHQLILICLAPTITVSGADSTLDCDFEDTQICGYTQETIWTDALDWTRGSGSASSNVSLPRNDHTFNSSVGHYMYASPARHGYSHLISKKYTPLSTAHCLELWYWFHYTNGYVQIDVFFRRGQLHDQIFSAYGNDKNKNRWILAQIEIPANSQPFKILIRGYCYRGDQGCIAIDDIVVKPWSCSGLPDVALSPVNTTYTLQEGSSLAPVICSCGMCKPNCSVQWTFNGGVLRDNGVLELKDVKRNRTGRYACTCTNPSSSKHDTKHFDLTVQYGPDDVVLTPDDSTYMLQELSSVPSVTCDCGMCEPRCTAQWTFDGIDVGINDNDTLRLMNVTRNTAGQYICTCANPSSLKLERRHFSLTIQ